MAVAKAATAAAFWSLTEVSESLGTAAKGLTARTVGARVEGATGAKAVAHAMRAAKRMTTDWQFFILNILYSVEEKEQRGIMSIKLHGRNGNCNQCFFHLCYFPDYYSNCICNAGAPTKQ